MSNLMPKQTAFTHVHSFEFYSYYDNNTERVRLEIESGWGSFKYQLSQKSHDFQDITPYLEKVKEAIDSKEDNCLFLIQHDNDRTNDLFLHLYGKEYLPVLQVFGKEID